MTYEAALIDRLARILVNIGGTPPGTLSPSNFDLVHLDYWRAIAQATGGAGISTANPEQELIRLIARTITNLGGSLPTLPSVTNFEAVHIAYLERLLTLAPFQLLHPDAVAYGAAIADNGGTIRSQDMAAFGVFAGAIASIRSKILHYSPVAGNDLNAARVKFYRDSHEVSNLLTFNNVVAADYSPALGFQAGAGRHIDSGFTPSLSPMQDFTANAALSAGFGCLLVSSGTGVGSQVDMGADHTAGLLGQRRVLMQNSSGNRLIDLYTSVERLTSAGSVLGFVFGSLNGNTMTHFDDGVSIGSRARSNITGQDMRPDVPVFFGCNNSQGVAAFHSTRQLRHFVMTTGMTNTEVQTLSTAIATLQGVLAS
jgi:hypothetical protein